MIQDGPNLGERAAQTRTTILTAAVARFGRDGYRSSSVADIARDAGVSGSLSYAYFGTKEALFQAALDADASGLIREAVGHLLESSERDLDWAAKVLPDLLSVLDGHPLARRVLAGLEPTVTPRIASLSALADLSGAIAERVREGQALGTVRAGVDPDLFGQGLLTIWASLLMVTVQFGLEAVSDLTPGVVAVVEAALSDDEAVGSY